jgi:hypothetical protein
LSIGVGSVRAEPFDVLRTGFVEAFSYRKKPFDRLRANGLINNPGLMLGLSTQMEIFQSHLHQQKFARTA